MGQGGLKGLALLHIHRENKVSPKEKVLNILYEKMPLGVTRLLSGDT